MPRFTGQNKKRIDPRYFLEETQPHFDITDMLINLVTAINNSDAEDIQNRAAALNNTRLININVEALIDELFRIGR